MVRRLKKNSGDDWLYTVTWNGRLPSIAEHGLVPDAPEAIGRGGYRSHSQGRVFLTHGDGVSYWYERYQAHADNQSDDVLQDEMIPVVLRMRAEAVSRPLQQDPLGTSDAHAPTWFVDCAIAPDDLELWDGAEWISVSDWESIDPALAVRTEPDPDDPERELHWWRNDEPLCPRLRQRNIGPVGDPFDRIMKTIDAIAAAGGKFEWLFASNDARLNAAIRRVIAEFGPFPGLHVRDKGRAVGIGTEDRRVFREFVLAIKALHDLGVPGCLDLAQAIMEPRHWRWQP
jgi:hypothetical protein